jgi:hypothetical protein
MIPIRHGMRETLEHYNPTPFATDIAISRGIEGLATAVRRQH